MNSVDGVLQKPQDGDTGEADYKLEMVELFKAGKINQARKLVCSHIPDEVEDITMADINTLFRMKKTRQCYSIIKQGLVDPHCCRSQINLAPTILLARQLIHINMTYRKRKLYKMQTLRLRRSMSVDCFYEGENMLIHRRMY